MAVSSLPVRSRRIPVVLLLVQNLGKSMTNKCLILGEYTTFLAGFTLNFLIFVLCTWFTMEWINFRLACTLP